uniref:Uncharacterized protein n=1 Tax=Oryza sativa subsp. japonica TaxID=39947 RepID=Q5SML7_ORYSJ|nr:hypothetical protein [Oryza sativa Japonica Group]
MTGPVCTRSRYRPLPLPLLSPSSAPAAGFGRGIVTAAGSVWEEARGLASTTTVEPSPPPPDLGGRRP